jgi:hypothetical protein
MEEDRRVIECEGSWRGRIIIIVGGRGMIDIRRGRCDEVG